MRAAWILGTLLFSALLSACDISGSVTVPFGPSDPPPKIIIVVPSDSASVVILGR